MKVKMNHLILLVAVALAGMTAPASAQPRDPGTPDALRRAPPEVDRSRPGGDPADPSRERSGGGPIGNDIIEDNEGSRRGQGVIRPPMGVDPGIQGSVPDPTPRTTPIIPPPGTPGGDPTVIPR